jgi:hypothetical protein
MAIHPSIGTSVPSKSYPTSTQYEPPALIGGLVQHLLVTASVQVQILSIVDETGSASVADIVAELSGHPDPVGAIQVMVELNILIVEINGVLDGNTIVRRADPEPDPRDKAWRVAAPAGVVGAGAPTQYARANRPVGSSSCAIPGGLDRLASNPFSPNVVVGHGPARRSFARMDDLRRPGVYVLLNANGVCAYVGTSSDVGLRVTLGQQPIADIATIVVITDSNDNLSDDDAKALERMLWSRVAAGRELTRINSLPDGAAVDAQRYSELEAFLSSACLTLRHNGVMFVEGPARNVLAGPRHEPRRVAPLRPFNEPPAGDIVELNFGAGMVALAARQSETRWILLQGSEVRIETVASANCSTRYLRAAWLHSGLLDVSPDGRSYVATRDLVFFSGSGLAQFCAGSKGRGLEAWKPINPPADQHPDPAILIAA